MLVPHLRTTALRVVRTRSRIKRPHDSPYDRSFPRTTAPPIPTLAPRSRTIAPPVRLAAPSSRPIALPVRLIAPLVRRVASRTRMPARQSGRSLGGGAGRSDLAARRVSTLDDRRRGRMLGLGRRRVACRPRTIVRATERSLGAGGASRPGIGWSRGLPDGRAAVSDERRAQNRIASPCRRIATRSRLTLVGTRGINSPFLESRFGIREDHPAGRTPARQLGRSIRGAPGTLPPPAGYLPMSNIELGIDTFGDVTVDADGRLQSQAQVLRNVVTEAERRGSMRRCTSRGALRRS